MDPDTRDMDPDVIFPRKLLKKFILLYKDLPCLWDKQSPAYKHKQRRHEAISRLTMLVKEYDPTATRVHVLRKIESLRACIRREHKRVVDSRRFATHRDQIYVPHLWYYELFSFVFGEDANNTALKSDVRPPEQAAESIEEDEEEAPAHEDPSFERQDYVADFSNVVEAVDSSSMAKRFPFEDDQSRSKRLCTEIGDEYDAIGVNVAAKLRALPPNMRILAEKLINDVLFQAQVNGLNSSTVISTTDPFKQDVM